MSFNRIDWKSFFIGFGAMFIALVLPYVGDMFINVVTKVRDSLPFSKKKIIETTSISSIPGTTPRINRTIIDDDAK